MNRDAAVEAVFQPVHAPTTFEETVERLGRAIRIGLLAPGTRLPPERALAAELGISRSTLRRALTTLIQSGHLESVRGRAGGSFVAERPPLSGTEDEPLGSDARALLERRVAVEAGATILAAERARRPSLDALDRLVRRMEAPADFETYRRADVRFHIGIAEAAGSAALVAEMTEVQARMTDLISRIAHPDEVLASANDQHRKLVAVLREGDAGRAVALIRAHIRGTEHILAGLV